MSRIVRAACVQLNSAPDMATNLAAIAPMLQAAKNQGAQFIALPENATMIAADAAARMAKAFPAATHPAMPFFSAQARELGVWLLCGSLTIKRDDGRLDNRSVLFAPDGTVAAHYNKIHLFDATVAQGENYHESATVAPGDRAVVATTALGKIGLTICYDMRFARLYRDLAKGGAEIITVPAAFTVPTGQAHWHALLRARAIETGCFIVAPAQGGTHEGGRKTYGHSLVVDPWGAVIAEAADDTPQIIFADLNLDDVARVRAMLPSLQHDRDYTLPEA
jgi:predicted amidohydrolase